jgi:hypothetical protein
MGISVEIEGQDSLGNTAKARVVRKNGHHGIVAYTAPLHPLQSATFGLINPIYGRSMNQSAPFTGTPVNIHDGTDNAYWTASALSGTWAFDSTDQNHTAAGTKSIDATSTANNREAQIEAPSPIDVNTYNSLVGWIYITGWSSSGSAKNVEFRLRLAGVDVGLSVDISGYIDVGVFNEWQQFIIPTVDFSSGSIDQLIIKTIDIGGGPPPDYYLDDLTFQEAGGFIDFSYAPPPDKRFTITSISTVMVDAVTELAGSNPLALLGLSKLTNGILLRFDVANQVVQSLPVKCTEDLAKFANVNPISTFSDDTNTMLKLVGNTEIKLDGRTRDCITYRIQDDLSGLLDMEVWLFGKIEDVS